MSSSRAVQATKWATNLPAMEDETCDGGDDPSDLDETEDVPEPEDEDTNEDMGCTGDGECEGTTACMSFACVDGECVPEFVEAFTTCDEQGGQVCDGAGACVASTCEDEGRGGDETDIDCGGECAPCVNDQTCLVNADCTSGLCSEENSVCVSCEGNDCGEDRYCNAGVCKGLNNLGDACETADTCQSGHCANGVCCNEACDGDCMVCSEAGICGAVEDGTACTDDGLHCTGPESCQAGICESEGNPCPGADGDDDCQESCNGEADDCSTNDEEETFCGEGMFCVAGVCELEPPGVGELCTALGECASGLVCHIFEDEAAAGLCLPGGCTVGEPCTIDGQASECIATENGNVCAITCNERNDICPANTGCLTDLGSTYTCAPDAHWDFGAFRAEGLATVLERAPPGSPEFHIPAIVPVTFFYSSQTPRARYQFNDNHDQFYDGFRQLDWNRCRDECEWNTSPGPFTVSDPSRIQPSRGLTEGEPIIPDDALTLDDGTVWEAEQLSLYELQGRQVYVETNTGKILRIGGINPEAWIPGPWIARMDLVGNFQRYSTMPDRFVNPITSFPSDCPNVDPKAFRLDIVYVLDATGSVINSFTELTDFLNRAGTVTHRASPFFTHVGYQLTRTKAFDNNDPIDAPHVLSSIERFGLTSDDDAFETVVDQLETNGYLWSTYRSSSIVDSMASAFEMLSEGRSSRAVKKAVVILTDGDGNRPCCDMDELSFQEMLDGVPVEEYECQVNTGGDCFAVHDAYLTQLYQEKIVGDFAPEVWVVSVGPNVSPSTIDLLSRHSQPHYLDSWAQLPTLQSSFILPAFSPWIPSDTLSSPGLGFASCE